MTLVLYWLDRFFVLVFYPLRSAGPWLFVFVVALLTAVFVLLVYRYTSNQSAIRRAKDRMQAHLLEVRLFPDQLGIVLRAYGRVLRWMLAYLGHSLVPLAVLFVPLALLLVQMDFRLAHEALHPHESFLLKVLAVRNASLDQASLRLPQGLALSAPPLHIVYAPENRQEVNWRIHALQLGDYSVEVVVGDRIFEKQVTVAGPGTTVRLSPARVRPDWLERFFESTEPPLPSDAPLHHIVVTYPHRSLALGKWELHWLVPFFVFSLAAAFALKGIMRTEF